MDAEIPDYIRKMGITRCTDFRAPRGFNDPHPILSYQLDPESVDVMDKQYQVAMQAAEAQQNHLAIKILWDLAENGYAPANRDLSRAFLYGRLDLKKNHYLTDIFSNRPCTKEDMIRIKSDVLYMWENREIIREEIRQAQEHFRDSLRAKSPSETKNDDNDTATTTRDSGSSIESVIIESITAAHSPLHDEANQTRSALFTSPAKEKDD